MSITTGSQPASMRSPGSFTSSTPYRVRIRVRHIVIGAALALFAVIGWQAGHGGSHALAPSSFDTSVGGSQVSGGPAHHYYDDSDWNEICAGGTVCQGGMPYLVPGGGLDISR
jgi:hypothetical protein